LLAAAEVPLEDKEVAAALADIVLIHLMQLQDQHLIK
jgi:hypothetical protein